MKICNKTRTSEGLESFSSMLKFCNISAENHLLGFKGLLSYWKFRKKGGTFWWNELSRESRTVPKKTWRGICSLAVSQIIVKVDFSLLKFATHQENWWLKKSDNFSLKKCRLKISIIQNRELNLGFVPKIWTKNWEVRWWAKLQSSLLSCINYCRVYLFRSIKYLTEFSKPVQILAVSRVFRFASNFCHFLGLV